MTTGTGRTAASPGAATPQAAGANRRLDIQGLRAIAVLMVVAFHAGLPTPGGFVGVDVFFVISGFVITAMLMREWVANGRVRFGRFYLRRFKRLTPALAVATAFTLMVSVVLLSPLGTQQTTSQTAAGAMLLAANIVIARTTGDYFDAPAEANPLLNTWSLSVEEQFYLIFPLILALSWILARRKGRGRAPYLAVMGVGLLSFGLALAGSSDFGWSWFEFIPDTLIGFYGPGSRAWEFALGAMLALTGAARDRVHPQVATGLGFLGLALLGVSMVLIEGSTPFPGVWALLPVSGTLLLLSSGTQPTNPITRALSSRPMVTIGDLSYSVYLWHWPLIVFAKATWPSSSMAVAMAAFLSLFPAYASYRWIEQPIRSMELPSRARVVRLIAMTLGPALALSGVVGYAAGKGFWSDAVIDMRDVVAPLHAGRAAGCDPIERGFDWVAAECEWNKDAPGSPIYLMGDSNADHFSEAVLGAAITVARPLFVSTASSCPFLDIAYHRSDLPPNREASCRTHVQRTLDFMDSSTPGLVIIANADYYARQLTVYLGAHESELSNDPAHKLNTLQSSLTATVKRLRSHGHEVMLVQTIPNWDGADAWNPQSCSLVNIITDGCAQDMRVTDALARQGAVRRIYQSSADTTGAVLLDPWEFLCGSESCSIRSDEHLRYRDYRHLTVAQSEALVDEFARAIGLVES